MAGDPVVTTGDTPAQRLRRFRLLASGIAGRALEVSAAMPGEAAWTDGGVVFLDPGASAADQVAALAVQASLIAAGSLDPALARQLRGRPSLARRYLAVEGHRALARSEDLLPWPARSLIDWAVAARVGGPAASLAIARGREVITGPPPGFGVIRPGRLLVSPGRRETAAAGTGWVPGSREPARQGRDGDDEAGQAGQPLEFFANAVGGRGALAWLFRRMFRLGRDPSGGPIQAGSSVRASLAPAAGRGAARTAADPGTLREMTAARRHGAAYPEWDLHRRCYRPDWCMVDEVVPRMADGMPMAVAGAATLRRPLARLGTGLVRRNRQLDGDDIDVDAAVEARADGLAGITRDQAVYVDTLRRQRDLAVLVLLDISGSAAEPGAGGKPVHEQQRATAAALAAALHGLGDRVGLYAFYSQGRTAVRFARVKGFDDALDTLALRRLGGLVPGAYTRLGAAVRHGAAMLEEQGGTPRRLLVVLSDGLAYDHGYERPYGEADSRRALAEARLRGIGCVCLTVGASTDPASLQRVFGTAAYASIPGPEQLAGVIGPLFRAALGSADLRRRL
jgi:hypothetical protein